MKTQRKPKTFRLNPLHLKVLRSLTDRLSRKSGTTYSQAQILERAITCLWQEEIGEDIYAAFAVEDDE